MQEHSADLLPAAPHPQSRIAVPAQLYPAAEYNAVLAMTKRLFPGEIDVRRETDPEIVGHEYMVFNVIAHGTVDDAISRDRQWHRELIQLAPKSPSVYCLNIDVQE